MRIAPASDPEALDRAVESLGAGELVAFPTETVYCLGADGTQPAAVEAIFRVKDRPRTSALIAHVLDYREALELVEGNPLAERLTTVFWPGPLTLVLPRRPDCPVAEAMSGGRGTLAVRSPSDPVARRLIGALGRPIAAPSANPTGGLSPTTAAQVVEGLGERVPTILDGGACRVGIETTVVDLVGSNLEGGSDGRPEVRILRLGPTSPEALAEVVRGRMLVPPSPGPPRRPKTRLPVRLDCEAAPPGHALLGLGGTPGAILDLSPAGDLHEAGANLFDFLRRLDDPERFAGIAVAPIPERGLGWAIRDRLLRCHPVVLEEPPS